MTTQNNNQKQSVRAIIKPMMQNIQILYQNGEITATEKEKICTLLRQALITGDCRDVHKEFTPLLQGTLFPDVVRECIQLTQ